MGFQWEGNAGGGALAAFPGTVLAQSDPIGTTGTYYVNATALVVNNPAEGVYCYTTTVDNGGGIYGDLGGTNVAATLSSAVYTSVAVADVWFIEAGDAFQMWCYSGGSTHNSTVYDSLSTATLINSPDFVPQKIRHSGESIGSTGPVK